MVSVIGCAELVALKCSSVAFGSPDSFVIGPKVYASKFIPTYQAFGTVTAPAAETKSIGLPTDAQLAAFFALPLIKYTLTRNLSTIYRDYATKTTLS
jgi:hypothetical protein